MDELADYIDRADSEAQDPNGAWITAQTGAPRGEDYTAGEALLPFESWQQAAGFLGWALEPPAAAETMHPVQGALAADDRESYFRALVRLNGDAATGALERVGLSQTWSDATGLLSVSVSELVGDGETGTLTAELRFAQGDTAWQAQDYTMPDGTATTLAVPQEGGRRQRPVCLLCQRRQGLHRRLAARRRNPAGRSPVPPARDFRQLCINGKKLAPLCRRSSAAAAGPAG